MSVLPPPRLPEAAERLLAEVGAPTRLVAHLTLVHGVAGELIAAIRARFPGLAFDGDAALFGAAVHDLGKAAHPEELSGPGTRHEAAGERILLDRGVPPERARFARTHGAWDRPGLSIEDLIVALADSLWKGQRRDRLETLAAQRIAGGAGQEVWEVWSWLDAAAERIAEGADERLAWQRSAGEPRRGPEGEDQRR